MEVKEYIQQKGWQYKEIGDEFITTCPFCGKLGHLYLNISGVYHCKVCGASGNLYQLRKFTGDLPVSDIISVTHKKIYKQPTQNLAEKYHTEITQETKDYLHNRNINNESILHFKLGTYVDQENKHWLSIPQFRDNKLINIKFRSLPPEEKTFRRTKDCESILFNCDCLKDNQDIILCEGEIDTITLWQNGFKNVVGTTIGAGGFSAEYYDLLRNKKIFICYDNDIAGQKSAIEINRRLQSSLNVELPCNDINEYFQKKETNFAMLLVEAKEYKMNNVIRLQDIGKDITDEQEKEGITTEWSVMNQIIDKWEYGMLIALSAPEKIGKTTLALNIATYNAKKQIPSLFYCLEMPARKIYDKFLKAEFEEEILTKEIRARQQYNIPLYIGYNYKKLSQEVVFSTIREAVGRYGIRFVVFDNLHFLCRNMQHISQEVGMISRGFKLLAEELEIVILLIVQPRKKANNEIINSQDLRDSGSIAMDSDQVIVMHRDRISSKEGEDLDNVYSPKTVIRCDASRYSAGGSRILYLKGEISKFMEN